MFSFLRTLVFGGEESKDKVTEETKNGGKEHRSFSGKVTSVEVDCGMVDHSVFFDLDKVVGGARPVLGDSVHVEAARDHAMACWRALSVQLVNQWDPSQDQEVEVSSVVGYIRDSGRGQWLVISGKEEIMFMEDSLVDDYVPVRGDWVMIRMEDNAPVEVKPLRQQTINGVVDRFTGVHGVVNGNVGFSLAVCATGYHPRLGDNVVVNCLECKHTNLYWRAIKVSPVGDDR